MTPLQFEAQYRAEWDELELLLDVALARKKIKRTTPRSASASASVPALTSTPVRGERLAALYRRACEHLALARARSYPAYLLDRLDRLTADAHQVIYQRRELGIDMLLQLVLRDFPRAVRAHAAYVWLATALLGVPLVAVGLLVYFRPELILSVVDAQTAAQYEEMYSESTQALGRTAGGDWTMFGFYIRNNVGIAFQCFAAGLFFGVGSIFFLVYNGATMGGVAGYLTERGLSSTFYAFVVTHGAFELTAIVLAGAAGLRIGHSLLAPGRYTRRHSLVIAARDCAVLVYGITAMLVVAAAIEAFWSSATWFPHALRYSIAAVCWIGVLSYLTLQGRDAD